MRQNTEGLEPNVKRNGAYTVNIVNPKAKPSSLNPIPNVQYHMLINTSRLRNRNLHENIKVAKSTP